MRFIQKELIDPTDFYYHYHDFKKEMQEFVESLENCFNQVLSIIADSPAEAVLWGTNFDDMITYPSYFKKEILPWLQKAADVLHSKGKIMILHADGENLGLMDLIANSGADVAEAITPYPMTKGRIEEYYEKWCRTGKLTIWGGIPEVLLLEETTTEDDFEAYLDHLFKVIAPGNRMILGIGDTTPAHALFDRLVKIGKYVEEKGHLPIKGGDFRPISKTQLSYATERVTPQLVSDEIFKIVQEDVLKGNHIDIKKHVRELVDKGVNPEDILQKGMISAMEVISDKFKRGDVFIPEVLLSARAMNEALLVLEPYLTSDKNDAHGKVLMATVHGDMHNIGKNMVITMLRGVGFEVQDMGVNVPISDIIEGIKKYKPNILGLSALLTTTMPEMKNVIDAIKTQNLREDVKIMVGGAPVNEKFARDIEADGYAPDAGEAVELAKQLIKDMI